MERATLGPKEAAAYIGESYGTILEMEKNGLNTHIRAGRRMLFRRYTLEIREGIIWRS